MKILAARQGGFSFVGFIVILMATIIVVITGFRSVPAYIENASIRQVFDAIASDPDLQHANVNDIHMSFIKRAQISNITVINADDIDIENDDGRLSLSASYSVKVHLVGNVNLLLEFNPSVPE